MADYVITARIDVEDGTTAGAQAAERNLERVEQKGARVGQSITASLGRAFAAIGGGYLLQRAVGGVIALNAEIETAVNGMGALLSAKFGLTIADGLSLARSELAGLREDAARGVGELGNYLTAYQLLLSPVTGAGGDLDKVRELTRQALAAGFALQGQAGLELAPRDVMQALSQGASTETFVVNQALDAAGISQSQFNAMTGAERLDALTEAFAKFEPAIEAMGKSWDAQMGTLRDGVSELLRMVTRPLFERWSEQLQATNRWLDEHMDQLESVLTVVGDRLVQAWDHVIANLKTYIALLTTATVLQQTGLAGAAGRGLLSMAAPAARAGAGSAASGAAGLATSMGVSWQAGGRIIALVGQMGGLGSALAVIAPVVLLVVTAILSLKAAMEQDLFGVLSGFVIPALMALREAGGQLFQALGELVGILAGVSDEGSILAYTGAWLMAVFGVLTLVLTGVVKALTILVHWWGILAALIVGTAQAIGRAVQGDFAGAQQALSTAWGTAQTHAGAAVDVLTGAEGTTTTGSGDPLGAAEDLKAKFAELYGDASRGARQAAPQVNIGSVKVEVKAEINEDPARIALGMEEVFTKINRYGVAAKLKMG